MQDDRLAERAFGGEVVEAAEVAEELEFPVIVRPSYVIGGRAMQVVYTLSELEDYLRRAIHLSPEHPILVDRYLEGKEVGLCTSGSPGPTVGKNIGLGYLPTAMSAIGTKFIIDCRGKQIEAEVVKTPFYARKKS